MKRELPKDVEARLKNWARYYRDRKHWKQCGSAEGNYRRISSDFEKEGWGEPAPPQQQAPVRFNAILEAVNTNDLIMQLSLLHKWALTYYYCFPYQPRAVVLRAMKKCTGRRLNWSQFVEQVEIGRVRFSFMVTTLTKCS